MSNKITEKQENFCREYILNGGNAAKAYKDTYTWNGKEEYARIKANKLMEKDYIRATIAELKKPKEEEFQFKREQAFNKYEKIYSIGIDKDNGLSAAKGAIDSQCKLYGLLIDKQQIDQNININPVFWINPEAPEEE